MDNDIPQITDQDRLDSAHKLFGKNAQSTLSAIDAEPVPANQSEPSSKNVEGIVNPDRWVIPQVDVAPTGDMPPAPPKPKGPAFLSQIQDAAPAPRQVASNSAPNAPEPSFLSSIPDVSNPTQQAYQGASLFDAAHSAIVRRLSNQFGQPPEFIDKNIAAAKSQANAPSTSFFQNMEQNYPGSTKFYAQPENMAVAHDDIPNSVQTESLVQNVREAHSLYDDFLSGYQGSSWGMSFHQDTKVDLPQDASFADRQAAMAGGMLGDLPAMTVGGMAGLFAGSPTGPGAVVAGSAGAFALPAAYKQALREYQAAGKDYTFQDVLGSTLRILKEGGKQAAVGAATGLTGFGTGLVANSLLAKTALSEGAQAFATAAAKGVTEAGAMEAAGKGVEGQKPTLQGAIDNLTGVLALHGATEGAKALGSLIGVDRGAGNQAFYDAAGKTAGSSKLRDRLPDVYGDFVNSLTKDTPVQDVYLPVDAATSYFQGKGIDLDSVAGQLGVGDSLEEARATGGDIKIPLAKWLEKMAGTEHYNALRDDIKFSPEDLSNNQSSQIASETRARVQDAADQALKGADVPEDSDQQARVDAAQRVYEDMQGMLSEVGMSAREIKYNPMLFRDFFSTLADRVNENAPDDQKVDAQYLQQRFSVDVNKYDSPAERDAARGRSFSSLDQKTYDQGRESPFDNITRIDFKKKSELQPKEIPDNIESHEVTTDFNSKVIDGSKFFPANENTGKAESENPNQRALDSLAARYSDEKTQKAVDKAVKKAQRPENGPYVGAKVMKGIGFVPNFSAEPTGNIGPERISKPHDLTGKTETDPLAWYDDKYGATKQLIEKHQISNKALTINTSSDLIGRDDYIAKMPADTTVNMHVLSKDPNVNRALFPGNPSRLRQESAIEKLKESGVKVNRIEPTRESLIEAAGGDKEAAKKLGVKVSELNDTIDRAIGPRLVQFNQSGGYRNVPDSLMGFISDAAKQRGFDDHNYSHTQYVEVTQPDGSSHVDAIKGLNEAHAIERARRNWDGADIKPLTEEEARAKDPDAVSFFQGDESDPRGQISFNPDGKAAIDLFKGSNASTILHEAGHYFLNVLGHVVEGEGAGSEGLKSDYASILKFLDVNSKDEIGTDQHEKFARAFEQYLSEGKAPSEGLREAFSTFKRWLTQVWRKVSFQNVDMSPEIRGVFDRMLATEDQISEARHGIDLDKEFNLDGVDEKTKTEIMGLREKARSKAEETLLKERMKETTADYKEKLESERAKYREAAAADVQEEPLFKAIDQLREQLSGRDPYEAAEASLRGELSPEESTEFQMLADEHGFTTADEMAKQISDAGANDLFGQKVDAMAEEALRNNGTIKGPDALREEALRAVHSEDSEHLLALEREALLDLAAKRVASVERRTQNRAQAKLETQAAKGEAAMILAKLPAVEAGRPQRFITQEKNAAARVARLVARGDYENAADAKQQQLIAHALVRESFAINEEQARHLKYIDKFKNRGGDLLDMPFGFVRQIDGLLGRFGFQDPRREDQTTLQAIASGMAKEGKGDEDIANATGLVQDSQGRWSQETLAQFQDRRNESYFAFQFPPEILGALGQTPDKMTISDLRAVREAIQTIAESGRKNDRFLNELIKVDIKEAAANFRSKVEKTFGKPYEDQLLPGKSDQGKLAEMLDNLKNLPDALNRTLDTMFTTCHKFDGLEEGPAKEFIYRPMAEAEARATTRMRGSMEEMEGIFAKHYSPGEFEKYKDTEVAQNGRKWTKENIISMALNWGNGGNRQRLLTMPGLDEGSVRQLFTHLGKKDWDFVQDSWNHIDKYWPEIKKLEMGINGVEPSKVEALKFKNEHGDYAGGYYPIAYDFEKSADAFQHRQTKDALFKQYSTARAATDQGHTEARVARVKRPLRLSLDVLANHHEDVIHDLEFRKSVIDLNRFLSEQDTKAAITNAVGVKGYAGIQDWLKGVAGGGSEPMSFWDKAAQWFRFKNTFFSMGYRIVSAPKIGIENMVNMSSEIGASGTARALKDYYLGDSSHEMVIEKSPFMRERAQHLDRDMGDLIVKQKGEGQGAFQKYAFFVHAYLDRGTSFPLWADSYRRAIADHGDESLAVHQADESVKRTFMTGGGVDQASFARGSELKKAMTVAYGYQSMMWNRFSRQRFQASLEWNNGDHLQAAATMAMASVYTFAFPALVTTLTAELMRNGPPSSSADEKKRMLKSMLEESTPLKFIPIARNLQSYLIGKAMGEHQRDLQLTVLDSVFQNLLDPAGEALSGHHGKNFAEESTHALSMAFGIPKQVNDIAFNFLDWQHGNGPKTWQDTLKTVTSRRHKK